MGKYFLAASRSQTPGRGARRHPVTHPCSRAPRPRTVTHVHVSVCALHAVTHAVRVHEGKGHQTQGKAAKSSCVLMRQLSSRSLSGCTMQGMPEPVARQPLRAAELHQPPQRPPRPFRLPTHPEPCRPAPAAAPRSLQRRALAQPGVNHLHPLLSSGFTFHNEIFPRSQ